MWNEKTDTEKIGNYVYGLAIPVYGSTYIVKYVGQASRSNPKRCFQHEEEAKKYLESQTASNVKKVETINYFASNARYEIIILAHNIPEGQLDTMENIYRQMADYGALLFSIEQNKVVFEHNLTNIAATHNAKIDDEIGAKMDVKPKTTGQIDELYANKHFYTRQEIASKLGSEKIIYVLNRPGIQTNNQGVEYIGDWSFKERRIKNDVEWMVFVGKNDLIEYVFRREDVKLVPHGEKKRFCTKGLINHVEVLEKDIDGEPCFNVDGKWPQRGFTYHKSMEK